MIKTYKQYKESVKDLLQPKSNDEMIKAISTTGDPNASFIPTRLKGLAGIFLLGYIETSYDDLVKLFGEPERRWANKKSRRAGNNFIWTLKTTSGRTVSIYDDTSGYLAVKLKNMLSFKWHIGGTNPIDKNNLLAYIYYRTLNENIRNILKPKSKEEILKNLPGNPDVIFTSTKISDSGWKLSEVEAQYDDLVKLFGEPDYGEDYRTIFNWNVISENGDLLYIYDYKEYKPINEIKTDSIMWHIGGKDQKAANDLVAYIFKNTL